MSNHQYALQEDYDNNGYLSPDYNHYQKIGIVCSTVKILKLNEYELLFQQMFTKT